MEQAIQSVQSFFKRKDVVISAHRYGIDAMGAMAQGLFASLLIGTIIKTLGQQLGLAFLVTAGGYAARAARSRWTRPWPGPRLPPHSRPPLPETPAPAAGPAS